MNTPAEREIDTPYYIILIVANKTLKKYKCYRCALSVACIEALTVPRTENLHKKKRLNYKKTN